MTTPTPTPWIAADDYDGKPVIVEKTMAGHIVRPCGLFNDDVERANLKHIERCVNSHAALVEALEAALEVVHHLRLCDVDGCHEMCVGSRIDAALQQARTP